MNLSTGLLFGYFANWSLYERQYFPSDIPLTRFTHLIYAFASISNNLLLEIPQCDEFFGLSGVQLGVSIGGYGNSQNFSQLVSSNEAVDCFIADAIGKMKGISFIDIDWEFPDESEMDLFICFLEKLSAALASASKYLTIALSAKNTFSGEHLQAIGKVCQAVNLMTYDYHSPQVASHLAPLKGAASVDATVKHYLQHIASEKLILGIACYGISFPGCLALEQSCEGERIKWRYARDVFDYAEVCDKLQESKPDKEAESDYFLLNGFLASCETACSLKQKVNYAMEKQLGGFMFWHIAADAKDDLHSLAFAVGQMIQTKDFISKSLLNSI